MKLNELKKATVKVSHDQETLQGMVIMALTQYDLYSDFLERCAEFGAIPWMSENEYIEFFNNFWACDYEDALAFNHKYSASYFEAEIEHVIAGAVYRINKIKEILDQYLFELEHYTK